MPNTTEIRQGIGLIHPDIKNMQSLVVLAAAASGEGWERQLDGSEERSHL